MIDFLFSSMVGWLGMTGLIVAGCIAAAWFFPPLRSIAAAVAVAAVTLAAAYSKGRRDRARLEKRRRDEAVARVEKDYEVIDRRSDSTDDVARRMRDGSF